MFKKKKFFFTGNWKRYFSSISVPYFFLALFVTAARKWSFFSTRGEKDFSLLFFFAETLFPQKSAFLSGFLGHFFSKKRKISISFVNFIVKKSIVCASTTNVLFLALLFCHSASPRDKKRGSKKHCLWSQTQKYLFFFFFLWTKSFIKNNYK